MSVVQGVVLAVVALTGTAVVLTRHPERQVFVYGIYGLVLTIFFVAAQAPDVALSELTVGTVIIPLIILLTLAKLRVDSQLDERERERQGTRGDR